MQIDLLMLYLAKYEGVARLPKPHLDPLVDLQYAIGIEDIDDDGQAVYVYKITGHGVAFLAAVLRRYPQFIVEECFQVDLAKIEPGETPKRRIKIDPDLLL